MKKDVVLVANIKDLTKVVLLMGGELIDVNNVEVFGQKVIKVVNKSGLIKGKAINLQIGMVDVFSN